MGEKNLSLLCSPGQTAPAPRTWPRCLRGRSSDRCPAPPALASPPHPARTRREPERQRRRAQPRGGAGGGGGESKGEKPALPEQRAGAEGAARLGRGDAAVPGRGAGGAGRGAARCAGCDTEGAGAGARVFPGETGWEICLPLLRSSFSLPTSLPSLIPTGLRDLCR